MERHAKLSVNLLLAVRHFLCAEKRALSQEVCMRAALTSCDLALSFPVRRLAERVCVLRRVDNISQYVIVLIYQTSHQEIDTPSHEILYPWWKGARRTSQNNGLTLSGDLDNESA
jgi:hypothetical protein